MQLRFGLILGIALAAGLGCSGSAAEQGTERGACYGNGTCNEGLTCLSDICVAAPDAQVVADAGEVGADAQADAGEAMPDAAGPDDAAVDGSVGLDAAPADSGAPDTGPQDTGPTDAAADAGLPDTGPGDTGGADSGPADTGAPDAGRPDAGPDANCNPVDTTGCPAGAAFCLWDPRNDRRSCDLAQGNLVLEQGCDVAAQDCAPGFACTQTAGQSQPECHRVCDVFAGGLSCQNLMGRHPVYNCSVINGSQQYGVCLGRGSFCDPLGPPCPTGEVCSFTGQNQTTCSPQGTAQRDQPCNLASNCAANQGLCIDLGSGGNCRLACDPNQMNPCGANARCTQITGQSFGVCLPVACQPFTNPCPSGSVCSAANGPVECRPAGVAPLGGACSAAMECAAPGVCVDLGAGDRCEQPCDANNACVAPQVCLTLTGFGFGVCR